MPSLVSLDLSRLRWVVVASWRFCRRCEIEAKRGEPLEDRNALHIWSAGRFSVAFARPARRGFGATRGPRRGIASVSRGRSVKDYRRLGGRENRFGNYACLCLWRTSEGNADAREPSSDRGRALDQEVEWHAPLSDPFTTHRWRKTLEDFVSSPRPLGVLSIFRGWRKSQPKNIRRSAGRPH